MIRAIVLIVFCAAAGSQALAQSLHVGASFPDKAKTHNCDFISMADGHTFVIGGRKGNIAFDDIWLTEYDRDLNKLNEAFILPHKVQKKDDFKKIIHLGGKLYLITSATPYDYNDRNLKAWEIDLANLSVSGNIILAEGPRKDRYYRGEYFIQTYDNHSKAIVFDHHSGNKGDREITVSVSWYQREFANPITVDYAIPIPESQGLFSRVDVDESGRIVALYTTYNGASLMEFSRESSKAEVHVILKESQGYKLNTEELEVSKDLFYAVLSLNKGEARGVSHLLYVVETPDHQLIKHVQEIDLDWLAENGSPAVKSTLEYYRKEEKVATLPLYSRGLHRIGDKKDYMVFASTFVSYDYDGSSHSANDDIFVFPLSVSDEKAVPILIPQRQSDGIKNIKYADINSFSGERELSIIFNGAKANLAYDTENFANLHMNKKAALVEYKITSDGRVTPAILYDYENDPYFIPYLNVDQAGNAVFMLGESGKNTRLFRLELE